MRLPLIEPVRLTPEQRSLYDEMRIGIASSYAGLTIESKQGALAGPFNPWLHQPDLGKAIWELNRALATATTLPDRPREVAILTVGAFYHAAFEIESHRILARRVRIDGNVVDAIAAGTRPAALPEQEACAYDVATALCTGGLLSAPLYEHALALFNPRATSELVYFVGYYALTCMTMNAFDVPPP